MAFKCVKLDSIQQDQALSMAGTVRLLDLVLAASRIRLHGIGPAMSAGFGVPGLVAPPDAGLGRFASFAIQ